MDYLTFALDRDKVDPDSLTYSNNNKTGTFQEHMRQDMSSNGDLQDLDEPEGCVFEADKGVLLLLSITQLQSEQLQARPRSQFKFKFNVSEMISTRAGWLRGVLVSPGPTHLTSTGPSVITSRSLTNQCSNKARLITACGGQRVNWCAT